MTIRSGPRSRVDTGTHVDDGQGGWRGTGGVGDLDVVDHVAVHKVQGVDPRLAIAVVGEQWPGVYVREGTKPSDWPTQLTTRAS